MQIFLNMKYNIIFTISIVLVNTNTLAPGSAKTLIFVKTPRSTLNIFYDY